MITQRGKAGVEPPSTPHGKCSRASVSRMVEKIRETEEDDEREGERERERERKRERARDTRGIPPTALFGRQASDDVRVLPTVTRITSLVAQLPSSAAGGLLE